jgi:hypothetical protein
MVKTDYARFTTTLGATLEVYGKDRSDGAMALWWKLLVPFDLAAIEAALAQHLRGNRFAPTPADIIAILQSKDGRPTADEAWAMIPRDESSSAPMTDEIAHALGIAQPLLSAGDQVAARRAFIDAYTRAVDEARAAGRPVKCWISFGWDAGGREGAVERAVQLGMIDRACGDRWLGLTDSGRATAPAVLEAGAGLKRIK